MILIKINNFLNDKDTYSWIITYIYSYDFRFFSNRNYESSTFNSKKQYKIVMIDSNDTELYTKLKEYFICNFSNIDLNIQFVNI